MDAASKLQFDHAAETENSWTPKLDVLALEDVTLSVSDISGTGFTLKVIIDGTTDAGVTGLIANDIVLLDSDGDTVTKTINEIGDGVYDVTATLSNGTYTVNLVSAANLSVSGFESTGAVEITVAVP